MLQVIEASSRTCRGGTFFFSGLLRIRSRIEPVGAGLSRRPNADAAQEVFLALLTGVETETFEGSAGVVTSLTFGPDTATLSPGLEVLAVPTDTFNGVYPISGDNVLLQAVGAAESAFTITFSTPALLSKGSGSR